MPASDSARTRPATPSGHSTPFTPKRPRSVASANTPDLTDGASSTSADSRLCIPNPFPPTKIRAVVSVESKTRKKAPNFNSPLSGLLGQRSRTNSPVPPSSPPKSPLKTALFSKMDDAVDPEESLVDWKTVEDGDVSVDIDELDGACVDALLGGAGSHDKVLATVRLKPAEHGESSAWTTPRPGVVLLDAAFARTGVPNAEIPYDNVLTGSNNKPIYNAAARSHVRAAMEGYNAVIFAYGQTASGKTFTLSGTDSEPGIIPRAMRDVFTHIRNTPSREFLLRASYLEIYKEQIHDLLAGVGHGAGAGLPLHDDGVVPGLREEVVMSVKGLREVMERGEANRRTASTDWNARSSRSHSVFRLIIESREVGSGSDAASNPFSQAGIPSTPGGSRLQARGGRSVQTSTLSLIDLAGSEKAASDKDRASEGKYINQSLLTLGTVIGTLAENAAKKKQDFVPYRNSKLTKLLQPSLSGNARISVICTINPAPSSVPESTATLQFASRVKKVALHAVRKEIIDSDALIERYRKEIEELKTRLSERERETVAPASLRRRLSAREKQDDNKAMLDLSSRIKQLTKLILTSQTIEERGGDESRPVSPCKLDFDLTPFQLQEELLSAKRTIESQANQILSLEATLSARPLLPADAPETEKDRLIGDLRQTVRELEIVTRGYEENLGAPLRAVKEDVEREWKPRVESLERKVNEKSLYVEELERALEKEKQLRLKSEQEKLALVGFVREIDSHISTKSGITPSSSIASLTHSFRPTLSPLAERTHHNTGLKEAFDEPSPSKAQIRKSQRMHMIPMPTSLLEENEVEFLVGGGDEVGDISFGTMEGDPVPDFPQRPKSRAAVGGDKENRAPSSER
ncbi:Kinesin-like protein kip2 [Tulasnella sp. 330]|nr:Kinesin-like protein kip2 [Tulasnella sp. 330]KAG8876120.1 Kinesin-like protein kip2 [Tulasnella sp. 331]